jgi:hypothetical protein
VEDERFNAMAKQFGIFEAMSDAELREMLRLAGWEEPRNKLEAVMNNMRREYGDAAVVDWLAESGRRGVTT